MVGWPQFPDITRINRSVLQMRPKYRNLATSASDRGVFLNQNGIQEAQALIKKIGTPKFINEKEQISKSSVITAERGKGKPRSVHAEDLIIKIRKSRLFNLFENARFDEAEAIDLIQMLSVYDHTPNRVS